MGEAVITRGGLGGGSTTLNDSTYQQLGLNNKSSFDDVILALAYKSNDYATIICDVVEPDGTPAIGANVNFIDGAGVKLEYQTDDTGRCIFKTNSGAANIFDNHRYMDIKSSEVYKVDCPVGFTKFIKIQRKIYGNGYSFSPITGNKNVIFSKFINNANVHIIGAGGGGGAWSGGVSAQEYPTSGSFVCGERYYGAAGNKGHENQAILQLEGNKEYNLIVGVAQAGGYHKSDTKSAQTKNRTPGRLAVSGQLSGSGSTGGTTSFGGMLSAAGGVGGAHSNYVNKTPGANYANRGSGYGAGGDYSGNCSTPTAVYSSSSWESGGATWYSISGYVTLYNSGGTNGVIYINNIQYKGGYNLAT